MFTNIQKIFEILDFKKKREFKILVVLMFIAMLLETIGISSMIPLINYFTNENILASYNINLQNFLLELGISQQNILNFILIFIVGVFLIKNLYMGLYGWLESRFAYKVRFDLGARLFDKYLNSPYLFHVENSSSNLTTKIVHETSIYGSALVHLSTLLTETLIILGILIFLLIIKPSETLILIFIGFFTSFTFYLALKKIISRLGKRREIAQKVQMKSLQQGLGAIKDIIIYKAQKNFINIFYSDSHNMANVAYKMYFLQKLPKIWFEVTTIALITFIIFVLSLQKLETNAIMATISIFLVSSLKIIPSINKILVSLQSIKYSEPSFNNLLADLKLKNINKMDVNHKEDEKIRFQKEIRFENVCFSYPKSHKEVLKNINFAIKKNEFIGIVGETGTGKSTLVDLLIGLIDPDEGSILIDGNKISNNSYFWKNNLGYVPQNLYLLDDSIKNNIALGYKKNEVSSTKVQNSIYNSQLTKFVSKLKNGLETNVGERGVKISGGEKQRIGIARALYNNPEILVFDEATSNLDLETESKILEILLKFKKKKTIIFITHRESSLNICDRVFRIENNAIKEIKKN